MYPFGLRVRGRGQKRAQLEGKLERETIVCVIQIQARDITDAFQAIQERVTMQVEAFCRLARVAVVGKESLQSGDELRVVAGVIFDQRSQRLFVELVQLITAL